MAELKYVDWDGLVYYDSKIKEYIKDRDENYLKMGGIIDFKKLPDPTYDTLHYVYKITDEFTTTDKLFDVEGLVYKADTWVMCVDLHNDASMYRYIVIYEGPDIEDINLDNYYTKDEVDKLIPDDFATQSDIAILDEAVAGNQAAIEELELTLTEYAKKSDIPSLDGYATEDFVRTEIAKAELNGGEVTEEELNNLLANYYNKSEVDSLIPDVSNLATKQELEDVQNTAGSNSIKLFAIESDLVDINNQLENIPTTYVTKDEVAAVEAKVDAIVIPEVPTKVSELENDAGYITVKDIPETDLSNYYNKTETENLIAEAVKDIEHPAVDLDGYATEEWVNEQGFIKDVPSEYITESELDAKGYLTEHQDISGKADKSDLQGLASIDYVDQLIANIPETDLSDYYTKGETTSAINEAIANINIPTVNLEPYATKAQVAEQVAAKADNILFTSDMRVTTASGGFELNDSVQNMTIAQILVKLLNLTEYNPSVTPEGILEGTPEVAVDLITNKVPSYMLANSGDIVENEYRYELMTVSEGAEDNQVDSFLYQIVDDNNIAIETGYQITTEFLDAGHLTVVLPETVNNFEVKVYDANSSNWAVPLWTLIENPNYSKAGYIAYTADPSYDIYEGLAIRVVIK